MMGRGCSPLPLLHLVNFNPIAMREMLLYRGVLADVPYDRESLALVMFVQSENHCCWELNSLCTDKQGLKILLTGSVRTSQRERWLVEIMRLMPDIKYVEGTAMQLQMP
jgi:hypothetical protein